MLRIQIPCYIQRVGAFNFDISYKDLEKGTRIHMMSRVKVCFLDNLPYFVGQNVRTPHNLHALDVAIGFQ